MERILCLPILFFSALFLLWRLGKSAPSLNQSLDDHHALKFPSKFEDISELAETLGQYKKDNPRYVLLLFSSAFLFKQTFAIPGSALLNVLAGALFGTWVALPLVSVLTAIGATLCFSLSRFCAYALILRFFSGRLAMLRQKVRENERSLFHFLLFARIFPMTPNWILNMASPFLGIPIHYFFASVFIGLIPYNFLCVEAGGTIAELKSVADIFTGPKTLLLLILATFFLIAGIFVRKKRNKSELGIVGLS